MAITKVTSGLISADASSIDLNIDAGTLYLDVSENRVGIGTTSPSRKLHVIESANNDVATFINNDATNGYGLNINAGGTASGRYSLRVANQANTVVLQANANGNVGIGQTSPSTKLSITAGSANGIELDQDSDLASDSARLFFSSSSGGYSIFNTSGNLRFSSGATAGSSSGTERMRIDSSGNVGIGTSSLSRQLQLYKSSNSAYSSSSMETTNLQLYIRNADTTVNNHVGIQFAVGNNSDTAIASVRTSDANAALTFGTRGTGSGNIIERMRIDSSGNVGIGTSSPTDSYNYGKTLDIHGSTGAVTYLRDSDATSNFGFLAYDGGTTNRCVIGGGGTAYLRFISGGSECGRFDSSGTFILGKTSDDINTTGLHIVSGSVYSGIPSTANSYHLRDTTNNTWEFYVTGAGQIHATSTSITSLSDERLKENIKDLETGLTEVMSLKPRRFDWKDKKEKNVAGFIAQEVETVLPDLIDDFMHDDLEDAKSVKMSDMIPTLVKAIQEQQTIIDDLKTRIETLENA